jgi:hypothetical protein
VVNSMAPNMNTAGKLLERWIDYGEKTSRTLRFDAWA